MQVGERKMRPVEHFDDDMPPQNFVMISKAHSAGISVRKVGPQITKEFHSDCILDAEKSYLTAAIFTPKLVPKNFVTTLTVADELTYYESITFERRTVLTKFSEATNIFLPKVIKRSYYSALLFNPNTTSRNYITAIELLPARKCVATEELNLVEENGAIKCVNKKAVNGDINENGDVNGCDQLISVNGEM